MRSPPGRGVHRVPDRRRHADGGYFAEPDAVAGHVLKALLVEVDVDLRCVADARDAIVLEVVGEHDTRSRVDVALLEERVADALDDASLALAAGQPLRVDVPGGDAAPHA